MKMLEIVLSSKPQIRETNNKLFSKGTKMSVRFLSGLHKSLLSSLTDKPSLYSPRNVSHRISRKLSSCRHFALRRNVSESPAISTSPTSLAFPSDSVSEDSPLSGDPFFLRTSHSFSFPDTFSQ